MDTNTLTALSEQIASLVDRTAPASVVQVQGRRRPRKRCRLQRKTSSSPTPGRSVGRGRRGKDRGRGRPQRRRRAGGLGPDDRPGRHQSRQPGALALHAWGPQPRRAPVRSQLQSRVRGVTPSPQARESLPSSRRTAPDRSRLRQIDQIIRITAPVHGGFAGGAVVDAAGQLMGIGGTAAEIRGLSVVVPAAIAWEERGTRARAHGRAKGRACLGIAGQPVRLPERQRDASGRDRALLVVDVNPRAVRRSQPA